MKYLALLVLAIVTITFTGCSSLSPAERNAWSAFGRSAAADAEAIALQRLEK